MHATNTQCKAWVGRADKLKLTIKNYKKRVNELEKEISRLTDDIESFDDVSYELSKHHVVIDNLFISARIDCNFTGYETINIEAPYTEMWGYAHIYRNAHNRKTWGLSFSYPDTNGPTSKFKGCDFKTFKEVELLAIRWILTNNNKDREKAVSFIKLRSKKRPNDECW
jgi:hypothetical protein